MLSPPTFRLLLMNSGICKTGDLGRNGSVGVLGYGMGAFVLDFCFLDSLPSVSSHDQRSAFGSWQSLYYTENPRNETKA